ncbi:phage tail protein I [Shewanella sp. VB17]|uniref:phage tail protein I n=1 Tax=Shewanella sp. VB17 TaxID=2739432 RepID=UPI001564CF48|nr:phage tail protein I [Shewanella sp. VB17]NRD72714.1 phage tail protein I [Shewanella sp. VB17]
MSHKSINNQTMSAKASLLPGNVSELERDLDVAIARIEELSIPISELWDPWHCPLDALPFLAWALSVDQWRSDWSATVKRQVVAGSIDVHRIKGTRTAIELALADLGVTVDLVEWFEAQPMAVPYTFDITAWVNQNLTVGAPSILGPELYQQLFAAVVNAKNTRSGFTFKVGAKFGANAIGASSVFEGQVAIARRDTQAVQVPLAGQSAMTMAMAGIGVGVSRHSTQSIIDASPTPAAVQVASGLQGSALIYRRVEPTMV